MEQDQCLMMETKRKYSVVASTNFTSPTTNPSSYGGHDSWEEQAFAEDAANSLGGSCIWPPRSYSCTFCRREFRSAQALGGHMNVHRRDRARLKQQPSSPNHSEILCHETHQLHKPVQIQNPFASFGGYLYPSPPVCGIAYKRTSPNSDLDFVLSASSSSPSKALLAPSSNGEEKTLIPLYDSSIPHKISSPLNISSESLINLAEDQRLYSCKFHPQAEIEKPYKGIMDSRFRGNNKGDKDNDYDDVDVDGAVSLNLVMQRTHQSVQFESSSEKVDHSCKKRKTDASSILFFPNSSSVDRQQQHHMKPKMFEFSPSSIEELDLELRLGNRSKV